VRSVNGDFGELDWMPVRYMHRTCRELLGLYRAASVVRWSRRCVTA
jgi:trehalose 6-phosphate synthase